MRQLHSHRSSSAVIMLVSLALGLIGFQAVGASPARAATTNNTVMTTTQSMSAATLNSRQVGTYAAGRHLNLICYAHGQSVKGYFSRWIPGGWDSLWYLVDDGHWVADVDIQTYSQNPVTSECPSGPVGVPMVTTQRMAGPGLNTGQAGTYQQYSALGLVCWARGQSVKGYSSRYISGGWDSLWYRTRDGYWVADVDLQTGSSGQVGPQCGQPGTPASSSREQRAVSWALSQVGSQQYDFLCGAFVANAYGKSALGYSNAISFYSALRGANQIHGGTAPAGALVFSRSSTDQGNGHVDIAVGNGTFVSGGVSRSYRELRGGGSTVQLMPTLNPSHGAVYLGWAYAPTSWRG